jgi:hypothetical protein
MVTRMTSKGQGREKAKVKTGRGGGKVKLGRDGKEKLIGKGRVGKLQRDMKTS